MVPPTTRSSIPGQPIPAEIEVAPDGRAVARFADGQIPPIEAASLDEVCARVGLDRKAVSDWTTVIFTRPQD
jgi:hypothetical protein